MAVIQHPISEAQGCPDQPVEVGRFAHAVFSHSEGTREQYREHAVEHLLLLGFREFRIAGSFGIVPPRIALLHQQSRRLNPLGAALGVAHQFLEMRNQQVAVSQIHNIERPAAAYGIIHNFIHLSRRRDPFFKNTYSFTDIVAENIICRETFHISSNDWHLAELFHDGQHARAKNGIIRLEIQFFRRPGKSVADLTRIAAVRYGNFLGKEIEIA